MIPLSPQGEKDDLCGGGNGRVMVKLWVRTLGKVLSYYGDGG